MLQRARHHVGMLVASGVGVTEGQWLVRDLVAMVRDGIAPELLTAIGLFLLIAMSGRYISKRQTR
jgi:hypothetical protein